MHQFNKLSRFLKPLVPLFLIISILLPSVVFAAIEDIAPKCRIGNLLQIWLQDFIKKVVDVVIDAVLDALCNVTDGLVCFGGDSVDLEGEALEILKHLETKELVSDVYARCYARNIFERSVDKILNIATRQGRDGGAAYVQNWRNFQTNAQYRGEAVFRAILANTQICNYLKQDVNGLFRVTDRDKVSLSGQNIRIDDLDPYTLRARCSLPADFDITKYRQDFAGNGGWGALLKMTEPQNNPYGLFLLSQTELKKQRNLEVSSDLREAADGFTAVRGLNALDSCSQRAPNGRCLFYKDIKTPAKIISESVASTIQQELAWITNVDEINELMGDFSDRIASRILNLGAPSINPPIELDPPAPDINVTRTPFPVSRTTGPPPPPGSGTPPPPGSCTELPNGQSGPFAGDIQSAAAEVRNTTTGILDGNSWPYTVLDIDGYFNAMERVLESRGFEVVRDQNEPSQEIAIWRSGDLSAEQYSIRTSGGLTRSAHKATNCELPS